MDCINYFGTTHNYTRWCQADGISDVISYRMFFRIKVSIVTTAIQGLQTITTHQYDNSINKTDASDYR